ncbi:MAG TPA: sigma-70 family RNA polymerase sigma factor [Fodinibius sp.]|nr:sigma-70 family RNA polymerase sigma factor [Fodinibius sp.]
MSSSSTDYSEIVSALRENRQNEVNDLLDELIGRLRDYLQVVLNASEDDAAECAQNTFLIVHEKIMQGAIRNEEHIFSYFLRVCRHEYFGMLDKRWNRKREDIERARDYEQHLISPEQQIERLQDEDRQKILEACLNRLKKEPREFIEFLMAHPDLSTRELSSRLEMSEANVRTKKSRLLSRLHACFRYKWNS